MLVVEFILLALHETLLGCSSKMPGNFNIFCNGLLNGSIQMTNKTSLTQDMHKINQIDKDSYYQLSEGL